MTKTFAAFIKNAVLFLLCIFALNNIFAQTPITRSVSISSNCGGYYEYVPANYNSSSQKYPVIFYMHSATAVGTGSSTDLSKILLEGPFYFINNKKLP